MSVSTGRCGPWSSIVAAGISATRPARTASLMSSHVMCSYRYGSFAIVAPPR